MNKLKIREIFTYLFRCDDWVLKSITIIGLFFIPIIGWLAILGYYIRITKKWIYREYDTLPDFSNFWNLVSTGFKNFLVGFLLIIPALVIALIWIASIPIGLSFHNRVLTLIIIVIAIFFSFILSILYSLFLGLILPYIFSAIALDKSYSEILDLSRIKKYLKENIVNSLIFMGIWFGLGIAQSIITTPFNIVANAIATVHDKFILTYPPSLGIYFLSIFIGVISGIYIASVLYSLAGNIYDIWISKNKFSEPQM